MKIYDATNQILGRLASVIAKNLLNGENVIVVNAEKAILSGNPRSKKEFYLQKIHKGDPHHGPFFSRYPDAIFRRTVRGMLPWDKPKGKKAFKRLKVFIGFPDELKNKLKEAPIQLKEADVSKLKTKYITLEELSLALGAKKRW
ncbi:MAG: 50S ribosomal protein L13 [Candidatus Aenigmatarchaeota archaeon]